MANRHVVDGDSGEDVELDGQVHCFIVRMGDELFDAVERHRQQLSRALRCKVSRAAALRGIAAQRLLRRKRAQVPEGQRELFGRPLVKDPLVAVEAERVARNAETKAHQR